jgi:hypothetical protein
VNREVVFTRGALCEAAQAKLTVGMRIDAERIFLPTFGGSSHDVLYFTFDLI